MVQQNIKMQCALEHTTTYMYTCVCTCIQICSYGVEASVSNYGLNKHNKQAFNKRQREQQSKVIQGQVCDSNSTQRSQSYNVKSYSLQDHLDAQVNVQRSQKGQSNKLTLSQHRRPKFKC